MKNILLTGGAGFIGSHVLDALLQNPDVGYVRVLDNFATGSRDNIRHHIKNPRFELLEGDIRDFDTCLKACSEMDMICHQAALGSVPRSLADPLTTNAVNATGTLNIFQSAVKSGIRRVVYAASSSTYGDSPGLPKREEIIGKPLSPYAVTKYVNELYATVFHNHYGLETIGLRYFNVFGPRQSPHGAYAAAIPLFIHLLMQGKRPTIHGDGSVSRDFTFVANAVQANMKALFSENKQVFGQVFNIACGKQTTMKELYRILQEALGSDLPPVFGPERKGDIRHSLADIAKAGEYLHYAPSHQVQEGLEITVEWFKNLKPGDAARIFIRHS